MFRRALLTILFAPIVSTCPAQSKGLCVTPNTSFAYLWLNSDELTRYYTSRYSSGAGGAMLNKATRGSKMSYGINVGYMFSPFLGLMTGFNVTRHKWKFHAENLLGSPKGTIDVAVSETFHEFPLYLRFVPGKTKIGVVVNTGISYLALQKGEERITVGSSAKTERQTDDVLGMYQQHNVTGFVNVGVMYSPTPYLQIEFTPELQMALLSTSAPGTGARPTMIGTRLSVMVLPFSIK